MLSVKDDIDGLLSTGSVLTSFVDYLLLMWVGLFCKHSDVVELYSNTLYRGTDEPRAEVNDAFSRKSLLK